MFDLVDSSIRRGSNSIVFGKFFQVERFRSSFCIELDKYRPSELGSIFFLGRKEQNCKKKLGGTYKRENFLILEKDVLVNNVGTTRQIQLILVPLDQKLGELTHKNINFSKK